MNMPKYNKLYSIKLFYPSKHIGGIIHKAMYTCGFWRTKNGQLIALHRDVKEWADRDRGMYNEYGPKPGQ